MVTVNMREVATKLSKTSRVKQAASSVQIAEDVQWDSKENALVLALQQE